MRIAYLAQSYPPMISGAAFFAQQIAEGMAQRGHQVLIIAASDKIDPYRVENDNLTVLRLRSIHNPMRVGQRFLLSPREAVMKALHEFQPDIVHAHEPLQIALLAIEYAKQAQIPNLLSIHQLPSFVTSYLPDSLRAGTESALWMYARWLCRQFTSIITPTQTISSLVAEMTGLPTNTIGYGIDLQSFHPLNADDDESAIRHKWDLPADVPLLLHVGRLDTDKCVDRVIYAAAQGMRGTNAHLLIVGDGTQKPALMKLSESLGISKRVHFPGFISMQDGLPEIYRIAHLFLTASEIETQGIVLLEAAASGLPIVAIRATCIPEIVHHGMNGYLAESGNVNGLSNAISLLLKDHQKAGTMGKVSALLAARHALAHTYHAHETLYDQLVHQMGTQRMLPKTSSRYEWWRRLKTWANFS
jgi:glycosyltransferase involved in cell wall biosynthesis